MYMFVAHIFLTCTAGCSGITVYNGKALGTYTLQPGLVAMYRPAVSVLHCAMRCISYPSCVVLSFNTRDVHSSCIMLLSSRPGQASNKTVSTTYCIRNCTTKGYSNGNLTTSTTIQTKIWASSQGYLTITTTSPTAIPTSSPTTTTIIPTTRSTPSITDLLNKTDLSTSASLTSTYKFSTTTLTASSSVTTSSSTTTTTPSSTTTAPKSTAPSTSPPNSQVCTCALSPSPDKTRKHIYITSRSSKSKHHPVYYYDFTMKKFLHLNLTLEGNIIRIAADTRRCRFFYIRRLSRSRSNLTSVCFDGSKSRVLDHGQLLGLHLDVEEKVLFYGKQIKHRVHIRNMKTDEERGRTVAKVKLTDTLRFELTFVAGDAKAKLAIWGVTTSNIHPHVYLVSCDYGRRGMKHTVELSLLDTGGCLASRSTYLVSGNYLKIYDKVLLKKLGKLVKCPFESFPLDPTGCAVDKLLYMLCQKNRKTPPYLFLFTMQKKRKRRVVFPFTGKPVVAVG